MVIGMVVSYFKKKKMYEMLCSLADTQLDKMKNASYKFYRGSEWLSCESDDIDYYKKYELYHAGFYISLKIYQWNEQEDSYKEIDKITYRIIDDELVKEYQRTEAYKESEEIKEWLKEMKHA